jgi:hypothetical protein
MLAFLLGFFRLIWLFGKGHHTVVLENLALQQQLATGPLPHTPIPAQGEDRVNINFRIQECRK